MLRLILILVVLLVAGVLIYAATRPDTFRIERSVRINAAPQKVFELVNNFHAWERWSPWEKIDPQIQRSYSGAAQGTGAVYEWSGNKQIGRGRMEITSSQVPSRVTIKLDFITPFEAHNTVEFVLVQDGQAIRVTQAMFGPSPFISKLMGLVFSIDKMVGDKYEEGLATLKQVAEQ